ncbi:hypothetical protein NQZ68_008673 [Dissostichus eleginoides]|nr:hypothetical protein NQZ68_008673 [Dissostichus eleginoides]
MRLEDKLKCMSVTGDHVPHAGGNSEPQMESWSVQCLKKGTEPEKRRLLQRLSCHRLSNITGPGACSQRVGND